VSGLFATASQARLFLLFVGLGAGVGILYDLLTLSYRGFGHKGRAIGDLLFVCVSACGVFSLLQRAGETFRSYAVLGVSVGWFLYASTVSFFLHKIGNKLLVNKRTKCRANS